MPTGDFICPYCGLYLQQRDLHGIGICVLNNWTFSEDVMEKNTLKKIYHVESPYQFGEVEGFFDENNNLITWWSGNNAHWRYMSDLIKYMGFEVVYLKQTDKQYKKMVDILKQELIDCYGYDPEKPDDPENEEE